MKKKQSFTLAILELTIYVDRLTSDWRIASPPALTAEC